MRTLVCGLLVIAFFHGEAEGKFLQVKGAVHVHTNFSTGTLSLEELVEEAQLNGIDTVIFAENFLLRFEYGLFPFRGLVKRVVEKPSVLRRGIERWLQSVEAAQAKFPAVILIPGVEVVPYYYWTGSLFGRNLTLHDTQKNMLVVGLDTAMDYLRIPAIGHRRVVSLQWPNLLTLALGMALVGLGIFLVRAEREQKVRLKRFLVKVRKRYRVPGWLALCCGGLLLLEGFMTSGLNPYRGDLGMKPYQGVIDAVESKGGMAFWSFPEAWDFHEVAFGPLGTVTIRTDPHPTVLPQSHGYTGFGALYADNVTFTEPGGEWDRVLLEYTEGHRQRPAWGIGELGYHGPPKRLDEILTVFLVADRSREAVLDALKSGRFYSIQPKPDYRLVLEDFSIGGNGSSEWILMGGAVEAGDRSLRIRLGVGTNDNRQVPFVLRLVRSGKLFRVIEGMTPFSEILEVAPPDRGRREFFRIELVKPHRLLSNPIFVGRET